MLTHLPYTGTVLRHRVVTACDFVWSSTLYTDNLKSESQLSNCLIHLNSFYKQETMYSTWSRKFVNFEYRGAAHAHFKLLLNTETHAVELVWRYLRH